jgi:hypothetical protein
MRKWFGGFPIYYKTAHGNTVEDVDGNKYVDFCLGDTGAMAGHSPDATVRAVHTRLATLGGATTMMPTEDAAWVANELRCAGAGMCHAVNERTARNAGPVSWCPRAVVASATSTRGPSPCLRRTPTATPFDSRAT